MVWSANSNSVLDFAIESTRGVQIGRSSRSRSSLARPGLLQLAEVTKSTAVFANYLQLYVPCSETRITNNCGNCDQRCDLIVNSRGEEWNIAYEI